MKHSSSASRLLSQVILSSRLILLSGVFLIGVGIFTLDLPQGETLGLTSLSAASPENNFYSGTFMIDTSKISPINTPLPEGGGSQSQLMSILNMLSRLFLYLMPILAAISLIVAGYYYILSGGSTDDTGRAKTIIKYNLMALIFALGSYSFILFIAQVLGS